MDSTPLGFDRTPEKRPPDSVSGSVVNGRYRIEEKIGAGGMSTVYRARHLQLDRDVALKMLKSDMPPEAKMLERFIQEARAESFLKHRNVLSAHAMGINDERQVYLVTDYLPGQSLSTILRKGKVEQNIARRLFLQICDGLAHAHSRGVIHRDLKPSNIMVLNGLEDPLVKIVDFGIAKLTASERASTQHLTQSGALLGSPAYMSPEQCLGSELDQRSDIYSLGCLMYETLTGQLPFPSETEYSILWSHINKQPPFFADVDPGSTASPDLEAIVHKCMAKQKEDRFADATQLKLALQEADLTVGITCKPTSNQTSLKGKRPAARFLRNTKIILACVAGMIVSTIVAGKDPIYRFVQSKIAVPLLQIRLADNKARLGIDQPQTLDTMVELADALKASGKTDQAASLYKDVLQHIGTSSPQVRHRTLYLLSGAFPTNPHQFCMAAHEAAIQMSNHGDIKDSESILEFCGYRMVSAPRWSRIADLNLLAEILSKNNQVPAAVKVTGDAIILSRGSTGVEAGIAVGDLYMHMGNQYAYLGDLTSARRCFRQAIEILPETTAPLQAVKQRAKQRLAELLTSKP